MSIAIFGSLPFLLSDTVGFIRKLPTQLIKAFKSTLDEVHESDLLIHVIDISNTDFEKHINAVEKTLTEINCIEKPQVFVFNKIDQYKYLPKDTDDLSPIKKENLSLKYWEETWMSKENKHVVFISCLQKINTDEFKNKLYELIKKIQSKKYPFNNFLY